MPWRLIQFIVLFAVFLVFIIFNLDNKCNISFGFTKIENVPVFVTIFFSFMLGMLCMLPFIFWHKARKKSKNVEGKGLLAKTEGRQGKDTDDKPTDPSLTDPKQYGID